MYYKKTFRKNKFNAKKTKIDGYTFDSIKEATRYKQLKFLQKNGDVHFFLRQVPFDVGAGIKYRLDFMVFWNDGTITYEDVKGKATETFKIKKKLVESQYPIEISIL
jgi:hypothetical protein